MLNPASAAIAAVLTVSTFGGLAFAHSGATGIVKQRMELMKDIADRMKEIAEMVRGRQDFDADTVRSAADAVAVHAGKVEELFPEGSVGGASEARRVIWDNWDDFSGLADELESTAVVLAEAAETAAGADDIRPYFANLGRTCSACHEDYRKAD
jgi:cytochrome c556